MGLFSWLFSKKSVEAKPASASLLLDFAAQNYRAGAFGSTDLKTKALAELVTLTRASGAGRYNAQGYFEWLPEQTPRLDHDPVTKAPLGLLIGSQRVNRNGFSTAFDSWQPSQMDVYPNAQQGLDGQQSAVRLVAKAVLAGHNIGAPIGPVVAGQEYVVRVRAKSDGLRYLVFNSNAKFFGTQDSACFDLVDGVVTLQSANNRASIRALSEGYWECTSVLKAFEEGKASVYWVASSVPEPKARPDRFVGDEEAGLILWGPECSEGSSMDTSYIPTTTAEPVTRLADEALLLLGSWFNAETGTFILEHDVPLGKVLLSSGDQVVTSVGVGRTALAYDAKGYYLSHNAGTYGTHKPINFVDALRLLASATDSADAHLKKLTYYPRIVTQAELVALS